jgi:UDP-N-acetylmuramoyl-L-alanyl-D-glutamate--2,6-diaminopimelate ligase
MAAMGLDAHGSARVSSASLRGEGEGAYAVVLDRREAIREAIFCAGEGDVVLVAGKGHEPYQEVNGVRRAFDDRVEARAALEARTAS